MKTGYTYVRTSKLLAICSQLNLVVVEQPSQYRVECPTDKTKRMYFGKGKKGVCLVDLSGFHSEFAIVHPKPPTSKVQEMLDFRLTEKQILRNFFKTAKLLVAKPVAPPPSPTNVELMNDSPVAA